MAEVVTDTANLAEGNSSATSSVQTLDDTFEHTMGDGTVLTVGKPRGVLKLRIRNLLGKDLRDDNNYQTMATAFLSIRQAVGAPLPPFVNPIQFEGFMSRFGTDENLNDFMQKFQSLLNPEQGRVVKKALLEALDLGLDEDGTEEYVRKALLPFARQAIEQIRD